MSESNSTSEIKATNRISAEDLPAPMKLNPVQVYNGVKYVPGLATKDIVKTIDNIKSLELRDDDVFIVGYPRTGNHWAHEVLHMILNQTTEYHPETYIESQLEMLGEDVQNQIDQRKSPRSLGFHLRFENLPKDIMKKGIKVIMLLRNPKDVMVSLFKLMHEQSNPTFKFEGTWDEFFNLSIQGEYLFGNWFDHILDAEDFMTSNPECPVYIHCFEKTKENPIDSLKSLSSFLGKPHDLVEDIAKAVEFETMKAGTKSKMSKFEKDAGLDQGVLRSGVFGQWKHRFTVEQSEQYDELLNEKLKHSILYPIVKAYTK